ncbi:hypothetical protein PLESTM_001280200, partial [Pleodorina starrii]
MLHLSTNRCRVPSGRASSACAHRRCLWRAQTMRTRAGADTATASPADHPSSSTVDRDAAWDLLRDFTLKEFRGAAQEPYLASTAKRQRLRDALKLAFACAYPPAGWMGPAADAEVLLGVVASDIKFAARAYRDWCEELGLPLIPPSSRVDGVSNAMQLRGGVYLKYNSKTQLCYVSRYDGKDRGVLLQLGQVQLGHFPLGFFDEAMA